MCVVGGGGGEGGLFLVSSWDGLRGDTHLFVPFSALVLICILYPFYTCIYLCLFQNVFKCSYDILQSPVNEILKINKIKDTG